MDFQAIGTTMESGFKLLFVDDDDINSAVFSVEKSKGNSDKISNKIACVQNISVMNFLIYCNTLLTQ